MTTAIFKAHLKSALIRPVFLILLVIALLLAPASAFAGDDDNPEPVVSPTSEHTGPEDQSGGFEAPAPAESFESSFDLEQDTSADFSDGTAGVDSGTDDTDGSDTSAPEQELAPPETAAGTSADADSPSDTEPPAVNPQASETDPPSGDTPPTVETEAPTAAPQNNEAETTTTYFQVAEVSMSPLLNPGAIIEIVSTTYADGDMVVAQTSDGKYVVKMLVGDQLVPLSAGVSYAVADVTVLGAASLSSMTAESLEQSGLTWNTVMAQTATAPAGSGTEADPYIIDSLSKLYWITAIDSADRPSQVNRWKAHYTQTVDIDASETSTWNSGLGWSPIGKYIYSNPLSLSFRGVYNGNNKTISGLVINRPTEDFIGLFGYASSEAELKDIKLVGITVTGKDSVGGLVGYNTGTITNSHITGNVTGNNFVGGLVGYNGGAISDSYASGTVDGHQDVGGLVGRNGGTIINSNATGTVTGSNIVVGYVVVQYSESVGGLVGSNIGQISDSYASGTVNGFFYTGGLVGSSSGEISYSYATGFVGGWTSGGLVGQNNDGTISYSYATGFVGGWTSGGLVGENNGGTISNSYWDTVTSGEPTSAGGTGKTTIEMQQLHTFSNWSISDQGGESTIWRIYEGSTYPLLRKLFSSTATITITADTKTYDGTTSLINGDYDIEANKIEGYVREGTVTYNAASKNAGEHEIILRGVYSNQLEYDLIFLTGNLVTISPYDLTLSNFVADGKVYDGAATVLSGAGFSDDRIAGDVLTFSYNVAFEDKNVGMGKDVKFTGIAISGGVDQNNYNLIATSGTATADITARDLTLSNFVAGSKVYDRTTAVIGDGFSDDRVSGDFLTFSYTVAFDDKNVGTGKDVDFTNIVISGGADQNNYNLVTTFGTAKANITARDLTLSNFVAGSKVYDGTTAVTGDGFDDDCVAGDVLTFSYNVAFANKNVGTDKDVNFTSIAISGGTDAGNYTLVTLSGVALADITARDLTLSNFVADNKEYDGTTAVTGDDFDDDRLGTDVLTFSYNVAFDDKNVGMGKDVDFTNIVISGGADQNNYNLLDTSGNAKANITPKSLVITANNISKLYYNAYVFTGTEFSTDGLVSGDNVTLADITSAGAPKTAFAGDYVISIGSAAGTGLSNYDITYVDGTMSVVLLSIGSFNGSDNQDLYLTNPFTALDDSALTVITGGPNAHITPAYITSGDQFDLAQALAAYTTALDRYKEVKDLLTDSQRALFETELAIAKAAILAMEARLMAADGLPYNLAALQAAYAAAAATLSAQQGFLSADQQAAANQLLAAIATVIAALQYGVT